MSASAYCASNHCPCSSTGFGDADGLRPGISYSHAPNDTTAYSTTERENKRSFEVIGAGHAIPPVAELLSSFLCLTKSN